jgi:hypothetical protein
MSSGPVSPGSLRAAAEVHRELGPEFSDAVVESFVDRIDREVARRAVDLQQAEASAQVSTSARRRALLVGLGAGALAAGVPLTVLAVWSVDHAVDFTYFDADRYHQHFNGVLQVIWIVLAAAFLIGCGVAFRMAHRRH